MDQLDRGGGSVEIRQRRSERFPDEIDESWAQALATAKSAVTHRLAKSFGAGVRQLQASVENLLDAVPIGLYAAFECGHA
jgi:hypothetical protein